VEGFNTFIADTAKTLPAPYGARSDKEDWLAAKLVGRWKNGAPLVSFPDAQPANYETAKEKSFLFGKQDPQGLACPFGAHIRRANPRDSFDATDPDQIALTNRHRLLRRGRAYVPADDPQADGEGLLFMCLNADIERQFEFVQQTWIGSGSFSGLVGEDDPIVGPGQDFTIPMQSGPDQVTGLASFVTVVGGGYFFLPGQRALEFLCELSAPAAARASAAKPAKAFV
jgi:deferrochelatase/peroxidase EfeB